MEPIKQEIINNIFENGDKLITGPILQTVLIDMIDDVNGKDQEILSKTGSWDDAVTQIPNLATKEEVTNLSESVARDIANVSVPEGVATEQWVQSQDYASKTYVNDAVSSSSVDLTGYATETWVQSQGYLTEHQDISNLATKTELTSVSESVQTDITNLSESVANSAVWEKGTGTDSIVQKVADGTNLPTATGNRAIATGHSTKASGPNSHAEGYSTEAPGFCSHAEGANTGASGAYSHAEGDFTTTKGDFSHAEGSNTTAKGSNSHAEGHWAVASGDYSHVEGDSTVASGSHSHAEGHRAVASGSYSHAEGSGSKASGTGSHAEGYDTNASGSYSHAEGYWTNASGEASHAEGVYTEASGNYSHTEGYNTNASGDSSHAEGNHTTASGNCSHAEGLSTEARRDYSHAEGNYTIASRDCSHAEGDHTNASGFYSHAEGAYAKASGEASHAEGFNTVTLNYYEHAQGRYNHSSTNQIFSIGTGNSDTDRRNAVSVLEVDNSGSYTSSFFVQNVGGYDGTNPTPGTNDLATVINNLPSGGGSSETLWKKGTGTDSIVQVIASGEKQPTATGERAIAEGQGTKAEGKASHAEGQSTKASGIGSHAEGFWTEAPGHDSHAEGETTQALGWSSHAEGKSTIASNDYEHAQGQYNYTSSNQIFSVGAGENVKATINRRNAVSILAVPNSETQINTASFFVQNIGGYDGTNPTPGTNDLATVINGLSSSGGSSETLWKKGTGQDSIAQIIANGTDQPTAEGTGSIATGKKTNASRNYSHAEGSYTSASGIGSHAEGNSTIASGLGSHAEGSYTNAKGNYSHAEGVYSITSGSYSHAEGYQTTASGDWSHAEGGYTNTSNEYEHAQGRYNHNSENQIFSIGAGESDASRRNAVSVLEVADNSGRYTSSVFIQNIGGYDGTNPTPGTNDLATVINGLSSGGSSETLWKKGTVTDSIVQAITGNNEANTPTATKTGAVAIGSQTTASGYYSHAEGDHATASGPACHAEGSYTSASGFASHAEGNSTIASNNYEHAQGRYNHNSENQIFSIGTGNSRTDRRNAVSVLEVSNDNSYTSSLFVQNVGGYDGTNPLPGTNDLATVINGISSSGGTGTSTETWTFTLEDGSTVTKNIVMR